MHIRSGWVAACAACLTAVLVVSCAGREGAEDTTGATSGATAGGTAAGSTMSDGNIVALYDEVNIADSSLAAIALPKATRNDVKDFARMMMSEHHALREKGLELARRPTGALPPWPKAEAPAVDPFKPAVDDARSALTSTARGAAFDSTYIAKEVAIHQAVLDWITSAEQQAQNQELKGILASTRPVIQKHLDQARALAQRATSTKSP